MNEEQKYFDFEANERVAEPYKRERGSAWRTAIGLQDRQRYLLTIKGLMLLDGNNS